MLMVEHFKVCVYVAEAPSHTTLKCFLWGCSNEPDRGGRSTGLVQFGV